MNPPTTKPNAEQTKSVAKWIFQRIHEHSPSDVAYVKTMEASSAQLKPETSELIASFVERSVSKSSFFVSSPLAQKTEWADREYRHAYMEAAIEQGVAWQIRANRKRREWSQEHLAGLIGTTQSGVSRMEDPEYGAHSLETLKDIAKAFDCALIVKFAGYSVLATESEFLSSEDLFSPSYDQELRGIGFERT